MSLATNIQRRPGSASYYVRVTVPADLQRAREAAGRKPAPEVWKSLRTRDPKEAKRLAPAVIDRIQAAWSAELAALRLGIPVPTEIARPLYVPTQTEIEAVVWRWIAQDLAAYERRRREHPRELENDRETRDAERKAIRGSLSIMIGNRKEFPTASDMYGNVAEELIRSRGWDVLPDSPEFLGICNAIRGARATALDAMAVRDDGRTLSPEANPKPPPREASQGDQGPVIPKAKAGETLAALLPVYLAENGATLSPEERAKKERVVKMFGEFVGTDTAINSIPQEAFQQFAQALRHYPANAGVRKEFRGKSFPAVVELNRKLAAKGEGTKPIGTASRNNNLAALSAYFKWLYSSGYTPLRNVSDNLLNPVNKAKSSRNAYTAAELAQIFALPLFNGAVDGKNLQVAGGHRVDDWRFWIPVCCLYTGARLGEIAQMRASDVKQVAGHWAFHITDDGDDMTVKTAGSIRVVPVHPELIRLGFLDYREGVRKGGAEKLFPGLTQDQYGRYSFGVSKFWTAYLKRNGIKGDAYRLRHTFVDALRAAGFMDEEIGPIVGHSKGGTTANYGNLPQVTMDRRAAMIAEVKYPITLAPPK